LVPSQNHHNTKAYLTSAPITRDTFPSDSLTHRAWREAKDRGRELFLGCEGSFEVFNERPMREEIVRYCVQDVHLLPRLWEYYQERLTPEWEERLRKEELERVEESQTPWFCGTGRYMTLGPVDWNWV
jgi:exonuclease 3'-5' domain-containing protein 1